MVDRPSRPHAFTLSLLWVTLRRPQQRHAGGRESPRRESEEEDEGKVLTFEFFVSMNSNEGTFPPATIHTSRPTSRCGGNNGWRGGVGRSRERR